MLSTINVGRFSHFMASKIAAHLITRRNKQTIKPRLILALGKNMLNIIV